MILKDRADAARKLLALIKNNKGVVVVSLLRGGAVIGGVLAKGLNAPHLPLPVAKIPSPSNEELALGAVCFDIVYLEGSVVNRLGLSKSQISQQINHANEKFSSYLNRFQITKDAFLILKNKVVFLVDDGIATGATARAALLYLKTFHPKKVVLVAPVAPTDFDPKGFDELIVLHQTANFSSISQFYEDFSPVNDNDLKKYFPKITL